MRTLFLFVLIFFNVVMGYTQNVSKAKAIDDLLVLNQTKAGTEQIMLGLIRSYMSKKPNAPKFLEQEIQNSLDYDGYMKKVKAAYDKIYSEDEIIELIELLKSGKIELYKEKNQRVAKVLYDIGSEFGRESVIIITKKLQSY